MVRQEPNDLSLRAYALQIWEHYSRKKAQKKPSVWQLAAGRNTYKGERVRVIKIYILHLPRDCEKNIVSGLRYT